MAPPSDAHARELAVYERARNVVIDAGAGTGKTTILVRRLLELVAPQDDGPAMSLDRIAAITFTRRAAGELRLRVRGRLLAELATPNLSTPRRTRLRAALASVDAAHIGTIHSFADRLLRLRPNAARLGPSYEVVDDRAALIGETSRLLLHASARGSLRRHVGPAIDGALVVEAEQTISDALRVGLRPVRRETEFWIDHGLDSLVEGFVEHRDVDSMVPPPWVPERAALQNALEALAGVGQSAAGRSIAATWLRRIGRRASELDADELDTIFADVAAEIFERRRPSRQFKKGAHCDNDAEVWRLYRRIDPDPKKGPGLGDDITGPLHRWLATRLLRTRPVILALYEDVKRRRGVLDEIDLLLLLRDLMRDDLESRAFYQRRFDHVFVDEFQDTDPLQSDILMYLGEAEAVARNIADVVVGAGRLTIVGDPLQSIYRFRRADVAAYADVCERLSTDALRVSLTVNFRSDAGLLGWANDGFRGIFGTTADDQRFDVGRGRVFHRDLDCGRTDGEEVSVHVLPLAGASLNAEACRKLEAEAMPHYLRWLVERSGVTVVDPANGERRAVGWGDVCVLAMSTMHLPMLFAQMDELGLPYTATGGTLFMQDPLQQQFVLALRALADPTDGPAAACLRRPPFFSVDLGELVRGRVGDVAAALQMETTIRALRSRRFLRSPGATARSLLEQTLLGATVAIGPNGAQRLGRLRELCHLADLIAFEDACDFDAVTARMRQWLDDPETIDAPPPVNARAVRVSTIHQAKGLEFPVVVLWDARATSEVPKYPRAWQVSRDGKAWMISLDRLRASHPPGKNLAASEVTMLSEERRRLSYVAVTRARDLLVVPREGARNDELLWSPLAAQESATVRVLEPYVEGRGAPWASATTTSDGVELLGDVTVHERAAARWASAVADAKRSSTRAVAVTSRAHRVQASTTRGVGTPEASDVVRFERTARHGPAFGVAVHHAIELILAEHVTAELAARRCATAAGLAPELIAEVEGDATRAIATLESLGLREAQVLRLEYPVAGLDADGTLLVGAIDLLALQRGELWIVDFKTDTPLIAGVPAEEQVAGYAAQLRLYARVLRDAGAAEGREIRCGLLFTADGSFAELPSGAS